MENQNNFLPIRTEEFESFEDLSLFVKDKSYISSRYKDNVLMLKYRDLPGSERDIFCENQVTFGNFKNKLRKLIKKSSFPDILATILPDTPIYIKVNISPATQIDYHYYTTPQLVEALIEYLKDQQYENITIIEAENNFVWMQNGFTLENQYRGIGYTYDKFLNLSKDKKKFSINFLGSLMELNKLLQNAFYINFAKGKNANFMLITGALKNIYGLIPSNNKFQLYHQKKSSINIEQATSAVNLALYPDYTFIDLIDTIHGNEEAVFTKKLNRHELEENHYPSNMLVCGRDSLSIDKFISVKMNYNQNDSPIVREFAKWRGDFDIAKCKIVGSNLTPFPNWKKIGYFTKIRSKIIDNLPVSRKIIKNAMLKFYYDTYGFVHNPSK